MYSVCLKASINDDDVGTMVGETDMTLMSRLYSSQVPAQSKHRCDFAGFMQGVAKFFI